MLFYEFIGEFNVILDSLDFFEIILWVIVCIVFAYMGYKFILDSKETSMFVFIGLFFVLAIGGRIIRLIAKFIVGHVYGDFSFEGIQVILAFSFLMFTYLAVFFYYLYLERDILKKTHHFFSIIVLIDITLSILNYFIPELFVLLTIIFLILVLVVPGCYIYVAWISTGDIRRNALLMMIGLMLIIFGLTLDSPTTAGLYVKIPFMPEFAKFGAPSLQILGAILYRYTFILGRK